MVNHIRGGGRSGFETLVTDIHQQNGWRTFIMGWSKVLHFKIENTRIKDTNGKRKFKRMLSFLFASLPRNRFLDVTQRSPKSSRSFGGALRDIQKRLRGRLPICGQTRAFRYEIVFRGIQPCFLHSGSECLACFEPTEAARFLKKFEVHSVLDGLGEVRF